MYILVFSVPLLLKRLHLKRHIPTITVCRGLVAMCTGFIQNNSQRMILRLLLGFFQEGYLLLCYLLFCFYLTFFSFSRRCS